MAIVFNCTCGRPLRAKEETAGRKTKCPHCGAVLSIPGTAARVESATKTEASALAHSDALPIEDLAWPTVDAPGARTGAGAATGASLGVPSGSGDPPRPSDLPRPTDGTVQYKVLGQKDHSASGKINLLRLEEVLNEHSRQGWIVKSTFVVDMPSHSGHHEELVVILER